MSQTQDVPQSIGWKTEEVFVQAFKAHPVLKNFRPVHEDSDDEAIRPAIVVKGIAEIFIANQNNVGKQLYKVTVQIDLKANRAKLSNEAAEPLFKQIMDVCTAMRMYPNNQDSSVNLYPVALFATKCFTMFQPMNTEEGDRSREDQTRSWSRRIPVIVQEIS